MASPTEVTFAANPSESAALHGHKAKTPIIAGAVSGSCVGLAWIIGVSIYIYKRQRRRARARAKGLKSHRDLEEPVADVESQYIIPPDPAVVRKPLVTVPEKVDRDPFAENAGACLAKFVDSHTMEAGPSGNASSNKAPDGICGVSSIESDSEASPSRTVTRSTARV
ncbi:hypothetical protein NEOLEDRAFT_1139556 [Neolentinus lepideus HHB14362 ss-1]|uniref:Uncharacterized protein n=1 Tax=Neolentinus lepideus HHB14362 ss-1 TaxID=1314782 RepID=A0A165PSN2_9AGAM|nr:hypothetical protein NEOLEDRAFT_1139556 [Neolentinus lepideus HHB14362 ss-1]